MMSAAAVTPLGLPPTKIKRQYKCSSCDHMTVNPRVHLRHRIDAHGHKVKIVECPMCVYACQYRQKLNRHLRLVHHIYPSNRVPMPPASPIEPIPLLTTHRQSQSQSQSQPPPPPPLSAAPLMAHQVANGLASSQQQQPPVGFDQNLMHMYAQQMHQQQQLQVQLQQSQQQPLVLPDQNSLQLQAYLTLMYLQLLQQPQMMR